MKNLKNLLVLTLIIFITFSCDKDDETSSEEETISKLIGTWKFTSSTTDGVTNTDIYICELLDNFIFTETTITSRYYEDPSGTNGSNCIEFTGPTQNYTVSGNQITSNGYSEKIKTLTNTTLILEDTEVNGSNTIIYTDIYTKQ